MKTFEQYTENYEVDNSASSELYDVLDSLVNKEEITAKLAGKIFSKFKDKYG